MSAILTGLISRFADACPAGSGGTFLGFPTWYKYLNGEYVAGKCSPKLDLVSNPNGFAAIILAIVELLLRVGGIVAVVFVIYGGFRYMTSQGEPENTRGAQQTIINALIGLFIVVLATGIVRFIGGQLK